jgi:ABC-type uncharacterized transport system substrate-binding protein
MELKSFRGNICQFIIIALFSLPLKAESKKIAIIIPPTASEASNIFNTIIKGLELNTPQFKKETFTLSTEKEALIKSWILDNKPFAIIAIGNAATVFANSLPINTTVITTGTLVTDKSINPGISLSFSETSLKKKLRFYLPHIKKIHIGDEGNNLIWFSNKEDYPEIVRTKIEGNQKSIVKYLWKTINNANPKSEAVWVNANIEHLFLYKLSELAWERNVTLVSNSIDHLDSATLLAFYPDFKGLGKRLGDILTIIVLSNNGAPPLEPLKAISQGINLRTARHLGVHIPEAIKSDFGVIIK